MRWNTIRDRLKKVLADPNAGFSDYTFNEALSLLVRERFIARASQCEVRDSLILKGGLLLTVAYIRPSRYTGDADFNLKHAKGLDSFQQAINSIISVDLDDGFTFSSNNGRLVSAEHREYDGAQFEISCEFGDVQRHSFIVDFGLGDVVEPERLPFPSIIQIKGEPLELLVYPPETIAAEKLQTCVARGVDNSRFKDYFDLYLLRDLVDKSKFTVAAEKTFKRRGTPYPGKLPEAMSGDLQRRWEAFLRSTQYRVMRPVPEDLKDVMAAIREFYGTGEL